MTFEELPKYCSERSCWRNTDKDICEHSCWRNTDKDICEHIGLCTRFFKKYGHPPSVFKKSGLPAQKFKVTIDLSWGIKAYREYYIVAKSPGKATYRVAKMMGMAGADFSNFVKYYYPCVERIANDSEIDYYLSYVETRYDSNEYTCRRMEFDNKNGKDDI